MENRDPEKFIGYKNYTEANFSRVKNQLNILALFGNGIDLQIMNYLESDYDTSYKQFYNYLVFRNFTEENIIFKEMTKNKEENDENWSDFESSLINIFDSNPDIDGAVLNKDFEDFQREFSNFLNNIITPDMLSDIGETASEDNFAINSLGYFLEDLSETNYRRIKFPSLTRLYTLFNWSIMNFNYTSLLDNLLFLDKKQFNPKPYSTVDTNFEFYRNPNQVDREYLYNSNYSYLSSYINLEISHPHGHQDIPKSMIFGFDNSNQINNSSQIDDEKVLVENYLKPYWAQNDLKYKSLFNETHLFIIYGMSLGHTDQWWWKKISESLEVTSAELIIYYFNEYEKKSEEDVVNFFIEKSEYEFNDEKSKNKVQEKMYVILYNSKTDLAAFKIKGSISDKD